MVEQQRVVTRPAATVATTIPHTAVVGPKKPTQAGVYVRWALLIATLLGMYVLLLYKDYYRPYVVERSQPLTSATRFTINTVVQHSIIDGHIEDVLNFYDKYTGNRQLTYLAVSLALMKDIPINLLFALAQWESGFNTSSVTSNDNGSYDVGWLKCNTYTFRQYTIEQLKDPVLNGELGSNFLVQQREKFGSWEEATVAYNAGTTDRVKAQSVKHLTSVLAIERKYDNDFVKAFTSRL